MTAGRCKAAGGKSKVVKGVPCTAEPKLFPWNAHRLGKVSVSMWNICISQVILLPFWLKLAQPNSKFWTCCSVSSNLVTAGDLTQSSFISLYLLFLKVTNIVLLPALGFNLFGRISSDICFRLIISDRTWRVRLQQNWVPEGLLIRRQTTCPFMFLNFVPRVVLFTWNHGYLVHQVSQSICASAL